MSNEPVPLPVRAQFSLTYADGRSVTLDVPGPRDASLTVDAMPAFDPGMAINDVPHLFRTARRVRLSVEMNDGRLIEPGDLPYVSEGVLDMARILRELEADPRNAWLIKLVQAAYDTGHAEGESCRGHDIAVAVEHSRDVDELVRALSELSDFGELRLGSEL